MKPIFLLLVFLFTKRTFSQIDSRLYLCKYNYTWQKDSTKESSKFTDIMYLDIGKSGAKYYSFLKQLGLHNSEEDVKNKKDLNYMVQNVGRYFTLSESEIISIDYKQKKIRVQDKLLNNAYYYFDTLKIPIWKISLDTLTILGRLCQKATTNYKGRKYIAWFSNTIPVASGPWLFSGLPGLILKISDINNQFVFECIELLSNQEKDNFFKEYDDLILIKKYRLRELKRLKAQDNTAFYKIENPSLTITRNTNSTVLSENKTLKPYNPIDLSK